jgi:hypothetical protein
MTRFESESVLAVALLRAAAPPAALAAAWGPHPSPSAQSELVRLLRSCPRAPDAAFLRRFVDAVAAGSSSAGSAQEDGDGWSLHDGLYELAASPLGELTGAPLGSSGDGAFISYFVHPAFDGDDAAAPRASLSRPLASVWRSTTFSHVSTGVWPAALALVDAVGLAAWAAGAAADARLERWRRLWSGVNVVELGGGTGLAGLCLAALSDRRRAAATTGLDVSALTLTDGDPRAVALMRANADANGLQVAVRCRELHWGDAAAAHLLEGEGEEGADGEGGRQSRGGSGASCDVVIGSDVCYEPSAVQPLVATVRALLRRGRGRGGAAAAASSAGAAAATATATAAALPAATTTAAAAPPARNLTAALDAVLGDDEAAGPPSRTRRPFGILANARRNAATYGALEAALDKSGLAWLDVTAELASLAAGRPVLDLRLPPSLGVGAAPPSDIRTVLVW